MIAGSGKKFYVLREEIAGKERLEKLLLKSAVALRDLKAKQHSYAM